MASSNNMEMASRALDLTARTIDLLSVVGRLADVTGTAALIAKELGRWLGREGLDEHELGFFLSKSQALLMPNDEERVKSFFRAVTSNRTQPAVVPLWAMPSGALGKYLTSDPQQRWISSTLCCLFRYHDQEYTKVFLSWFLTMCSMEGRSIPQKTQLNASPVKLKLDMVVKKVVESTYLHVANAGLVGSDEECPKLPAEFDWACDQGHNIEPYHMAILIKNISEATNEIIIQSKHLLTNALLWMLWHYPGRLRVVVGTKVVFDRVLGSDKRTVECRVAKFCATNSDACGTTEGDGPQAFFYVMENISHSLNLLFRAVYDDVEYRDRTGLCVRQKLYEWPHRYPKGHKSTQIQTRATAREIMKWFLKLPVESASIDTYRTAIVFDVSLTSGSGSSRHDLTVGDLLGRSPHLLNMPAKLDRTFVVFSAEDAQGIQRLKDLPIGYNTEEFIRCILSFFPILQDLVQEMKANCECHQCQLLSEQGEQGDTLSTFNYDSNCLGYLAFSETMFYFSHAVADAFGSPDASGLPSFSTSLEGDLGALAILDDIIRGSRPGNLGTVTWDSMFNTALRVFLGAPPMDSSPKSLNEAHRQRFGTSGIDGGGVPTVVAVQFGSLAVIAPWLDISRPLSCRRSFRFEIVYGRLAFCSTTADGTPSLRGLSGDLCVVETQRTEDVSTVNSASPPEVQKAGTVLSLGSDDSEERWDWIVVPVSQTRQTILLRVVSGEISRMVQPSMAIRQLARALEAPPCNHRPSSDGSVPDNSLVELSNFEELLGRWVDPISDDDSEYDSDMEDDEDAPKLPPRKKPKVILSPRTFKRRISKPTHLCTSLLLESAFKFNTALALAGSGPLLVNNEDCCLNCCLQLATEVKDKERDFQPKDLHNPSSRCIISKRRGMIERLPLPILDRRAIRE
ncbi:hypothetical protein ACHAP5_008944 [Fusarium lateritium]